MTAMLSHINLLLQTMWLYAVRQCWLSSSPVLHLCCCPACRLRALAVPANDTYDYCAPSITLSGCKCHPNWSLQGDTYYGSCANDGDTQGSWCVVDTTSCPGNYRAHQYGANSTTQVTINGQSINKTLTGLNFDYCQVTTLNGCHCQNPWTYGNRTYHGTCRQGLVDGATLPGFSAETSWCYIDSGCAGAGYLEGYRFDVCTAEGGRVTDTGAACSLPATYHGVVMYDCLSYNQTTGNTSQPWCFTNTTSEEWGYCAPWSCSAALKQHCPAVDPSTAASLTPWTSSSCLETLCNSQQALVNTSQCTTDLPQDIALLNNTFKFLSGSTQFGQALQSTTGTGEVWLTLEGPVAPLVHPPAGQGHGLMHAAGTIGF